MILPQSSPSPRPARGRLTVAAGAEGRTERMDVAVLQETPGEVEDNAVVHHGFTSYMRDHETGVDLDGFV